MSTWLIRSFDALLLGAVLGAMALFAPACTSLDELERVEQRLTQTRDELREEQRQLEIRLANLSPDSPLGPDVRVAIEAAAAKAQAAEAIADHMRTVVERARNPEHDPATGPAGVLTSILPAPWRVPVALGSALLVTLGRAAQLKRGLRSVAQSIEIAKRSDEQFKSAFARHAEAIKATQTRTAQAVVAQATATPARWSVPI
jgi:hypothetical protein